MSQNLLAYKKNFGLYDILTVNKWCIEKSHAHLYKYTRSLNASAVSLLTSFTHQDPTRPLYRACDIMNTNKITQNIPVPITTCNNKQKSHLHILVLRFIKLKQNKELGYRHIWTCIHGHCSMCTECSSRKFQRPESKTMSKRFQNSTQAPAAKVFQKRWSRRETHERLI